MNKNKIVAGSSFGILLLFSLFPTSNTFADEISSQTEITPLDNLIGIEKTTLSLTVPENNSLPWAFVEGKIVNHVLDFPVIIQIFDNDSTVTGNDIGAVHFAQTSVESDGSYEYKFRVQALDGDTVNNIFEGDYTVKIFKVVYLHSTTASI